LEPLLPPERPCTGRPNHNHRTILNGILWVLRTGAPWRDLPERYGPVGTVSSRFYRWRVARIWDRLLAALQSQAEERNEVDWSLHFVDATVIRAHRHRQLVPPWSRRYARPGLCALTATPKRPHR